MGRLKLVNVLKSTFTL